MMACFLATEKANAFYNPQSGRGLSRDPMEEQAEINLYRSMNNDSINATDPLGLATFTLDCHYYKCKFNGLGPVIPAFKACPGGGNGVYVVASYVCQAVWAH
jgi:hypothetical protein